jgi:S1-C subfamily serine protease
MASTGFIGRIDTIIGPPKGPAGAAGLLLGDVVTAWDGEAMASVREMLARLDPDSVGSTVTLDLVRGGKGMRIAVRIAERAAA